MSLQSNSNVSASSHGLSTLSCQECRRRKTKCDRQLPTCVACMNSAIACVYPDGPLKPGPKPGVIRRSKRRRLDSPSHSRGETDIEQRSVLSHHDSNPNIEPPFAQYQPVHPSIDGASHTASTYPMSVSDGPSGQSIPSQSPDQNSINTHRRLSLLIHPNHEPKSKPANSVGASTVEPSADQSTPFFIQESLMGPICQALRMEAREVDNLINLYFENMTSFTLFTPGLLAVKLQGAPLTQVIAILASMFCFSAHFRPEHQSTLNDDPTASHKQTLLAANEFYSISKKHVDQELMDLNCPPPLLLVQAMTLLSFHDLGRSAEGRGWRSLGPLVRIAYELRLHLVDNTPGDSSTESADIWSAKEERRRTWWAIWELDVFSSTVRRLPSAIDWNQNWTKLPVDDDFWLQKKPRESCYLVPDPMQRSKLLQDSGNQSGRAWFIVANSLMRTAYCVSNSQEYFWTPSSFNPPIPGQKQLSQQQISAQIQNAHEILSNSIHCFSMALPRQLRYRGQHLFSDVEYAAATTKQLEADIYSIHAMLRLTEFMSNDPNTLVHGTSPVDVDSSFFKRRESLKSLEGQESRNMNKMVTKNISMAERVLSLVRNSGPDQVRFLNPFLSSTIWVTTAVFLVYKYLGISNENSQEQLVVDSYVDVMKTTFQQFVQCWNMSDVLESKLSELEAELVCMRRVGNTTSTSAKENSQNTSRDQTTSRPANGALNGRNLPGDTHDTPTPGAPLNGSYHVQNTGFSPDDTGTLNPQDTINMQDRWSSAAFETGSGLFDGDFQYDVELQAFLDSMFATYRGQDLWKL